MSGCVLVCLSSPLTFSFSPAPGTLSCYLSVLQLKDWCTGKQKVGKATEICTRELNVSTLAHGMSNQQRPH
ncbi:hypothetical protein M758_UG277200 [Ceratodon purpureus]|nr:hypothetical protein M758_UG277200 [Ceratodon purpureus]